MFKIAFIQVLFLQGFLLYSIKNTFYYCKKCNGNWDPCKKCNFHSGYICSADDHSQIGRFDTSKNVGFLQQNFFLYTFSYEYPQEIPDPIASPSSDKTLSQL